MESMKLKKIQGEEWHPTSIVHQILLYATYIVKSFKEVASSIDIMEIQVGWIKREEGWIKINSDGVVYGNNGLAGGGTLLCDSLTKCVHALADPIPSCTSFVIEAVAARWWLQLTQILRYTKIILAIDSRSLCTFMSLEKQTEWPSNVAVVLEDNKVMCNEFHQVKWS